MNFKHIALEEFNKMAEEFPNYSLVEIIYSVLTELSPGKKLGWLLQEDDYKLYTAVENAIKNEKEDE